jgi:hypothetical protein
MRPASVSRFELVDRPVRSTQPAAQLAAKACQQLDGHRWDLGRERRKVLAAQRVDHERDPRPPPRLPNVAPGRRNNLLTSNRETGFASRLSSFRRRNRVAAGKRSD